MTSKEAKEAIEIIENNLAILEILKQYVWFDEKDNLIKMNPIRECETSFDFEILQEWLENDLRRKLQN